MLKEVVKSFMSEEDGIGVVEIILILVVLIGLVIIFQGKITEIVNNIFSSITSKKDEVINY